MRLNEETLVQVYKILVRSVIDYSSLLATSMSNTNLRELETIQNKCLRIIYKVNPLDHITNESLREKAKSGTIKQRLTALANTYKAKAIITENPLIDSLIKNYGAFKNRHLINPNVADTDEFRRQIQDYNTEK